MKTYKIQFKKIDKENPLMYINLFRQFLYELDENLVPGELTILESHDFKNYMDPQIFADRLGLIKFDKKAENQILNFKIKNESPGPRQIYSDELNFQTSNGDYCEVLTKNVLLFVMPENKQLSGSISFIKGKGIDNGRFLSYAGFGYDSEKDTYKVFVDSIYDISEKLNEVKKRVEEIILESKNI